MFGLGRFGGALEKFTAFLTLQRNAHARWRQGYLKDLYHRRILCGAEPLVHRSAYPNWDYGSEIYAFSHRIGAPETAESCIVRALTDKSFYTRADVAEETVGAQPSKQVVDVKYDGDNSEFIEKGKEILDYVVTGYLRYALPAAPEELIEAVAREMMSENSLSLVAKYLGFKYIIRTAEFPPSPKSLSNSFKAILAAIERKRAETLVLDSVLPQILDIDFVEVFPLKDPLGVVIDILHSKGVKDVQPRILHSAGEASAEPVYLVGIFSDGELCGRGPGETLAVAVDMAARNTLLKRWKLTDEFAIILGNRVHDIQLQDFQSPNYFLKDECSLQTDLSTWSYDGSDPLKVGDVAEHYWKEVVPAIGRPLRKRLRHKFSRGSIFRRDFRRVLKPRPYTVC